MQELWTQEQHLEIDGYTLTFDGMEPLPFAMLEDYTSIPFDNTGFTNEGSPFPTVS